MYLSTYSEIYVTLGQIAHVEVSDIADIFMSDFGGYMKRRLPLMIVSILSLLSFQFTCAINAFAAPGSADLAVDLNLNAYGRIAWFTVENNGDETIESFSFDFTVENADLISHFSSISETTATTPGTINFTTGEWVGELGNGQRLTFGLVLDVTGNNGDAESLDVEITSSSLLGGGVNIDPNSSDDSSGDSWVIEDAPDLSVSSRLLTPGTITTGTEISYELSIANVGQGSLVTSEKTDLYFLIPAQASFVNLTDLDPSDGVTLDGACMDMGAAS